MIADLEYNRRTVASINECDCRHDEVAGAVALGGCRISRRHADVRDTSLKNPHGDETVLTRLRRIGIGDGVEYYLLGRHRGAYYVVPVRWRGGLPALKSSRVIILGDEVVATVTIGEASND